MGGNEKMVEVLRRGVELNARMVEEFKRELERMK